MKNIFNTKFHLRFIANPIIRYYSNHISKYVGVNENQSREIPIIVSLTSYEERFKDLEVSLFSLLNQTVKPDKIILWLSDEYELNDLPYAVSKYVKNGLEIRFVKDLHSYTKFYYTFKEYKENIIVTADDDIYYPQDWLEKLYLSYISYPNDIHLHRAHRVLINEGKIFPYEKWTKHVKEESARYDNFITGVGGALYPPNCFSKEVLRSDIFMKYAPFADDIWLWLMALLNNRKIRVVKNHISTLTCVNLFRQLGLTRQKTLYSINKKGRNDRQLKKLMKLYGQNIINKL